MIIIKHIYGPVPSRRLGRSLGIDVIPKSIKTCNFNCIYCQLGRTEKITDERKTFFPVDEIFNELVMHVKKVGMKNIDYFTFVGNGEPTLYLKLGILINMIKKKFKIPITVITNGALLYDKEVRNELLSCLSSTDIIMPNLDAGDEKQFKYINRPIRSIKYDRMIDGMIEFREKFKGKIWMEFMGIKDVNDDEESLEKIRLKLERIKPDRVNINVPIRPPAEPWVKIPEPEKVAFIHAYLDGIGENVDITQQEFGDFFIEGGNQKLVEKNLLDVIKRHPMRLEQVEEVLKKNGVSEITNFIENMTKNNSVKLKTYRNITFLIPTN
ncbi:MAG: radical SAM protein [Promethearchaeota archaeon]